MNKLLTEHDILEASKQRRRQVRIAKDDIVTPAAKDAALSHNIEIVKGASSPDFQPGRPDSTLQVQRVVLGCDHGGFSLKGHLQGHIEALGFATEDVGTFSEESVDYPDYAHLVAQKVARDLTLVGIIIDGAGVGSAMTANKVPGIRAAACYDVYTARNSREHNYANVLTLGSRVTGIDIAKAIVKVWLTTDYGAARHGRRVEKITQVEQKYCT